MCGIAGMISGSRPVDLPRVGARMAASLFHRGPDAHGVRLLPRDKGVLAHTRLKIIDLSERAAQPFVSGDLTLSFNGEIYNFQALRKARARDGFQFTSESDTEVILAQYALLGVAGLDALDGMFAFALWDAAKERLILARDRIGKKPLYWAIAPDGALVFGSEIKALWAHPALEPEIDPARLPELLTYGYVTTPRSLYQGIHKLPPASRLIFRPGSSPEIERYWSLVERPPLHISVEEAKREVRRSVSRAVEKRLVADVPLGAFLSGGIDSSIIVAEMARLSGSRVRTFSVGFADDATYDETRYAREIAERFGTEHTEITVGAHQPELIEQLLGYHDEPYGDSSALAVYAVARATRQHVTVVLTGDGGDEVFAGYTRFRGGLLTGVVPGPVAALGKRLAARLPDPTGYKHPVALLRRFLEHGDQTGDEQLLAWNSFFAGASLTRLLRPEAYGPRFDAWSVMAEQAAILAGSRAAGHDRLDQILRHNLATYLLDDLLVKTDRMTMAVALEARCPFLDTELLELAFRIPSRIKLRFGQLKWLLRAAYRDLIPASILDRKKHGFGVPVGRWWNGALAPMVDDLLLAPSARAAEYLDPSALRALVAEHRSGLRDHGQRIFVLIQLELWLRSLGAARAQPEALAS